MLSVDINKNDIYKCIYFIVAIAQKQSKASMGGSLSSRGDLIGGIFDRWINTVPESIIFNKIILPSISKKNVEVISDYYMYDPGHNKAGIAPDVIGLNINDKIVPFVKFNERWEPVEGMPQIEIKTFKKPQKMVSLRDQGYSGKYLVMAESDFRIDYLLPFFNSEIFNKEIYKELKMNDQAFIVSNEKGNIHEIAEIDFSEAKIGSVALLKITDADTFKNYSTYCNEHVCAHYIKDITKQDKQPTQQNCNNFLSEYCDKNEIGLYRMNYKWYDNLLEDGIPYYVKNSKNKNKLNVRNYYKTLDISVDNINAIKVLKKSFSSLYIEILENAQINDIPLQRGYYKVELACLDRSSNPGSEFFMQKSLVKYLPDKEVILKNILKEIIDKNSN